MHAYLKVLLLSVLAFGIAYLMRETIVPNVVPVADGEQSNWQVQLAFVLMSVENIGLGGAVLLIVAFVLDRLQKLLYPNAR